MNRTSIEWTDFSANPLKYRDAAGNVVWACVHASPGCQHCYSEALAKRYGKGGPFNVPTTSEVTPFLDEKELRRMLTYRPAAGKRCFVGDMTDVFGEWVPDALLDRLFAVFALRDDVTWQVLTKRAERMRAYLTDENTITRIEEQLWEMHTDDTTNAMPYDGIIKNVWLGVSAEDQQRADQRIPHLLQTPAAVRLISAEPLLGPIALRQSWCDYLEGWDTESEHASTCQGECQECPVAVQVQTHRLDWVIVGGESGPGARACDERWIRGILDQCRVAGVPVFVKQLGTVCNVDQRCRDCDPCIAGQPCALAYSVRCSFNDRKGGDPAEWNPYLRVRQFPEEAVPA